MRCNSCDKDMILELKIKNKFGIIEKWKCSCKKEKIRPVVKKRVKGQSWRVKWDKKRLKI